jgi:hypothetical protein
MTNLQTKYWVTTLAALTIVATSTSINSSRSIADCDPAVGIDPADPTIQLPCFVTVTTDACCESNNCGLPFGEVCGDPNIGPCISCEYQFKTERAWKVRLATTQGWTGANPAGYSICQVKLSDCEWDDEAFCNYVCEEHADFIPCSSFHNWQADWESPTCHQ